MKRWSILQDAAFSTGHRWLLEVIPPDFETDAGLVVSAVEELYDSVCGRIGGNCRRCRTTMRGPRSRGDTAIRSAMRRRCRARLREAASGIVRSIRIRAAVRLSHRLCDRPLGVAAAGGRVVLGRITSVTAFTTFLKPDAYFDTAWRREPGGGPVLINLIHGIDDSRLRSHRAPAGHDLERGAWLSAGQRGGKLRNRRTLSNIMIRVWFWLRNSLDARLAAKTA